MFFLNFKRILGHECNPTMMASSLRHHLVGTAGKGGNHDDMVAQQSKDAIIYVTVSIIESHSCYERKTSFAVRYCHIRLHESVIYISLIG